MDESRKNGFEKFVSLAKCIVVQKLLNNQLGKIICGWISRSHIWLWTSQKKNTNCSIRCIQTAIQF